MTTSKVKPIPEMIQRVKINLREQEVDVFDYAGQYIPHPLYFKSRLIPQSFAYYEEQVAFDKQLTALRGFDFAGFGPAHDELYAVLSHLGLTIHGFDLQPLPGAQQQHRPRLAEF